MTTAPRTTVLWRPTGPAELALVAESGWRTWPPRLPDQPIFYPVLNEAYAVLIARDWNVPASGAGYVTRFEVRTDYLDNYDVQQAGGRDILEYWIPAEDLEEFNRNIIGAIEVVRRFPADAPLPDRALTRARGRHGSSFARTLVDGCRRGSDGSVQGCRTDLHHRGPRIIGPEGDGVHRELALRCVEGLGLGQDDADVRGAADDHGERVVARPVELQRFRAVVGAQFVADRSDVGQWDVEGDAA